MRPSSATGRCARARPWPWGFFLWAQAVFTGRRFALCGKTIGALRRNVLSELLPRLKELGAQIQERRSENRLTVSLGGHTNDFYLFGGRDEAAAGMIQGMTLAGVLMDEVALMPAPSWSRPAPGAR